MLALPASIAVACLNLEEAEEPAGSGGAGTGGGGLGDASWTTGGSAGDSSAGSGGFVAGNCDSCGAPGGCECVPQVEAGWAHVRIADGKLNACPGATGAPVVVGSGAVDTGCGSCQCGSASGASCGFALVTYSQPGCATTGYYGSVHNQAGQCVPYGGSSAGVMLKAFGVGGSCDDGTAAPKAPAFATPKTLCSQPSGGACGASGACVAAASSSFDEKACVMFESQGVDVACPPGYPEKLPFSTGFDDTRQCACNCKPSVACSGGTAFFDCTAGSGNDAYQCKDGTTINDFKVVAPPTTTNADCSPDGATTLKSGQVVASGLRVVCCR